jgi:hypothetical protein
MALIPIPTPQQNVVAAAQGAFTAGAASLTRLLTLLGNVVWHNADGLTPQQACDALGADAGTMFQAAALVLQLSALVSPPDPPANPTPAWATVTINPDKTVTITGTPS